MCVLQKCCNRASKVDTNVGQSIAAKQSKTKQIKTNQNKTKQNKTKPKQTLSVPIARHVLRPTLCATTRRSNNTRDDMSCEGVAYSERKKERCTCLYLIDDSRCPCLFLAPHSTIGRKRRKCHLCAVQNSKFVQRSWFGAAI